MHKTIGDNERNVGSSIHTGPHPITPVIANCMKDHWLVLTIAHIAVRGITPNKYRLILASLLIRTRPQLLRTLAVYRPLPPPQSQDRQYRGMRSLGSIASLEIRMSLAELSQASTGSTTHLDPHARSFVFESSQNDTATEL